MQLRDKLTEELFSRHAGPDDARPELVDQLVTLLAYELECPVTQETRDERKR